MYIILPIDLAVLLITWLSIRQYTHIWVNRPITMGESIIAGCAAWLFLLTVTMWFGGILLTLREFFTVRDPVDIWALIFSVFVTGYGVDFILRAKSEMQVDDTMDFIKEAIQFRRSAQRRLDLLTLMQTRRVQKSKQIPGDDPEALQRIKLQAELGKGRELETQLEMLRGGLLVDITEIWRSHTKLISLQQMHDRITEAKIDPQKKRFSLYADFPELNEEQLKDETVILRLNRQIYDFLQSLNSEPWLRPYTPHVESYFLQCRATQENPEGGTMLYPFMKVGIVIADLRKLEGSYFNPRKLSELAAFAFNNGARV